MPSWGRMDRARVGLRRAHSRPPAGRDWRWRFVRRRLSVLAVCALLMVAIGFLEAPRALPAPAIRVVSGTVSSVTRPCYRSQSTASVPLAGAKIVLRSGRLRPPTVSRRRRPFPGQDPWRGRAGRLHRAVGRETLGPARRIRFAAVRDRHGTAPGGRAVRDQPDHPRRARRRRGEHLVGAERRHPRGVVRVSQAAPADPGALAVQGRSERLDR